ncbi:MAG: SCO family protein [Vicinamibacterales bacterium]
MSVGQGFRRAACALALAALTAAAGCTRTPAVERLPVLPIGGDFALTDHDGQPFTLASQRGKIILIFFGYSSCPDACPTTLSKLATVARRLGDDKGRMRTLYISVDPDRDTPPVLKADLANFALDALGLTGTKEAIDTVVAQYGAAYEIVPTPESAAKYTVSHTTTVFALDAQGRVRKTFAYEATVDEIVEGIRAILAQPA